jgi:hypothetical protein
VSPQPGRAGLPVPMRRPPAARAAGTMRASMPAPCHAVASEWPANGPEAPGRHRGAWMARLRGVGRRRATMARFSGAW